MSCELDEDVPPLEDMSEVIEQLKIKEKMKNHFVSGTTSYLEPHKDELSAKTESIEKMLNKNVKDKSMSLQGSKPTKQKSSKSDNYCGFKKGFLVSTSHKKLPQRSSESKTNAENNFDVVKSSRENNNKILPEVQDAIQSQTAPLLNSTDWVTDELLSKIMAHPTLSKQFLDPRFNEAITKFQTNPGEVMKMCETNVELREFIQQFSSIMGDHFTELAQQKDQLKECTTRPTTVDQHKSPSTDFTTTSHGISHQDNAHVQKILSNPELSAILKTNEIQKLLYLLKTEPTRAQRFITNADDSLRYKIHALIDAGLLQFSNG